MYAIVLFIIIRLFSLSGPLSNYSFSRSVYDRNGKLLRLSLSKDEKYRIFTDIKNIAPSMKEAILLREDRFFYYHPGFNPVALTRAAFSFRRGEKRGASTITMQLARLIYRLDTKTIQGKLLQIVLAILLEIRYSKNQIFEAYLNILPLGKNIEGVGAASYLYLQKSAMDLNPAESLTLAVIPPRPSLRRKNEEELKYFRQILFLEWIKKHPEDKNLFVSFDKKIEITSALPFYAQHLTERILNSDQSNNIINTTIDLDIQNILTQQLQSYIESKKSSGIVNGSALLIHGFTSEVYASAGSTDFFNPQISGQVDGTRARRSPGSALKPMLYALATDRGFIHPATVLLDVPLQFSTYKPENFENEFYGPISARQALTMSRNIPALRLSAKLRKDSFYKFLKENGVHLPHEENYYGQAPVLGGIEITMEELAAFYASLLNGGMLNSLKYLDTQTVYKKRIFSPQAAYLTLQMLSTDDEWNSESSPALKKFQTYIKTGTSSGYRDAWTAGIFGPYILIVWVGNFDGSPNPAFTGREAALPLFSNMVSAISANMSGIRDEVQKPEGIHEIEVCTVSGMIPKGFCPHRKKTLFIPGKSSIEPCNIHREVYIDTMTGKRTCRPGEHTIKEVYEFWSSDVAKTYQELGMARSKPPEHDGSCSDRERNIQDPEITLPVRNVTYYIKKTGEDIPLRASAEPSVDFIYWFVNDDFIARSIPGETVYWKGSPGNYQLRAVDASGGSDTMPLKVSPDTHSNIP